MTCTIALQLTAFAIGFITFSHAYTNDSSVSLRLWSFDNAGSTSLNISLPRNSCFKAIPPCVLSNVSFAMWTELQPRLKLRFFADEACREVAYEPTDNDSQSVAFIKAGVDPKIGSFLYSDGGSVMAYENVFCTA